MRGEIQEKYRRKRGHTDGERQLKEMKEKGRNKKETYTEKMKIRRK